MVDKVKIDSLYSIHEANLRLLDKDSPESGGMEPVEIANIFKGSDLFFDVQTAELKKAGEATLTLDQGLACMEALLNADTSGDHYIDVKETAVFLREHLPEGQARTIDPEAYLQSVQRLIANRYDPMAKNLQAISVQRSFEPTLRLLRDSSEGLYRDEERHAHSSFAWNGLSKSLFNAVMFVPAAVNNLYHAVHNIFTSDAKDDQYTPFMTGDAMALARAEKGKIERGAVIKRLERKIEDSIRAQKPWALSGDLKAIIEAEEDPNPKLGIEKTSKEDRRVLVDQLGALELHDFANIKNVAEQFKVAKEFVKKESPGPLGWGSGHSSRLSNLNFWNYTGATNNLYLGRSIMDYFVNKARTGDEKADEVMHEEARNSRRHVRGDGLSGFNNLLLCWYPGIPYRPWSDEDKIAFPGQTIEIGLSVYGGYKGIKGLGSAWELRQYKGLGEVAKVWWEEAQWYKPLPTNAFSEARAAAKAEATASEALGNVVEKKYLLGRFGRKIDGFTKGAGTWIKNKALSKLPPLTAEQEAKLKAYGAVPGKVGTVVTYAALIGGLYYEVDDKLAGDYNPHKIEYLDYELDIDKQPIPTKPGSSDDSKQK